MIDIPLEYIINNFYLYNGFVKYNKLNKTYQGSCAICREGNSWGKKKRCYYIPKNNNIFCHNCGWSSTPLKWIKHVSNKSFGEIMQEISNYDFKIDISKKVNETTTENIVKNVATLPGDCVNLYDDTQLTFYSDNSYINQAIDLCKLRRLFTAVNRPKSLWYCLDGDKTHKNRIIIPFYVDNKIVHYQSRKVHVSDNKPKYLTKIGSHSVFNYDNVNPESEYLFIIEGPIDSFFVRDSIAICGIQESSETLFHSEQEKLIKTFLSKKIIWVLDNQYEDKASYNKTKQLINSNQLVFIWPKGIKSKDINEFCIKEKCDEFMSHFILTNTYSGVKARIKLIS